MSIESQILATTYEDIVVEAGTAILADMHFDLNRKHLLVMTEKAVSWIFYITFAKLLPWHPQKITWWMLLLNDTRGRSILSKVQSAMRIPMCLEILCTLFMDGAMPTNAVYSTQFI